MDNPGDRGETSSQRPDAQRESFWRSVRMPDLVKRRGEVIRRQRKPLRRLLNLLKRILPVLILVLAVYFLASDPARLEVLQQRLEGFIRVLAFVILVIVAGISQFVAIFWFMSRSRVERIRPEDPKVVNFDDYWGQPNLKRLVRQWLGLLSDREQFVKMGGRYRLYR